MRQKNDKPSTEERIAKYEALIKQLEGFAKQNLTVYQARIRLLIALGYAYILFLLLFCFVLLWLVVMGLKTGNGAYILVRGGWIVLVIIYVILRSLWVRLPAPNEGIELHRAKYPTLFGMLDEISHRLQSPSFNVVRLNGELNAGVVQIPRFGILGGYRNYLLIGLPLLHALSPEEFKSIMAHEFGHLSANHGRFGNKIYRTRVTWAALLESFGEEAALFTKFYRWYIPYFSAYTFVLARADEYAADRCAIELTSVKVFGDGLLKVEVASQQLNKSFWEPFGEQIKALAQPPAHPFKGLVTALRQTPEPTHFVEWMEGILRKKTDYDDTHPSATDRLQAVGYTQGKLDAEALQLEPTTVSAAEFYLGEQLLPLTEALEKEWLEQIASTWAEGYSQYQKLEQELQKLEQKQEPLTEKEEILRLEWTETLRSPETALPLYQEYLASHPDNAKVNFETGRLLLQIQKDPAGIALIEKAMLLEPYSVFIGCKLLYTFLSSIHREEEAEAYRKRYLHDLDEYEKGQAERNILTRNDVFLPPNLKPDVLTSVQEQIAEYEMIVEVYLIRKEVKVFPQKPFYVFFVNVKVPFRQETTAFTAQVVRHFATNLEFPEEFVVFSTHQQGQYLKRVKGLNGSAIYKKK